MGLTPHGQIALLVTFAVLLGMQRRHGAPPELLFLGGLVAVTLAGVITPEQALAGFSNSAVLTIAALFAVAAALRHTGVLDWFGQKLLGNVETELGALKRLALTVVPLSAFVLNTPLVAMLVPVVIEWCRKRGVSPSRLLIPLSYLTILGGVCTMIGTSTTLVVNGLLKEQADYFLRSQDPAAREFAATLQGMTLFEVGRVGLVCAVVGTLFLVLIGRRLLPNRTQLVDQLGDHRREYLVEMLVRAPCPLIGQTVHAAGLRNLPGLFLIEIDRGGEVITPVAPHDVIHPDDRLVFTGVVATIVDLEKIPGLMPAADMTYELDPARSPERHLTEAVLSRTSPLIGVTVRDANFRQRYNAAIVAVHRNGVRLTNKIGNIVLEPGDTLLLQARTDFVTAYRDSRDFYLVSLVGGSGGRRHDRALLAALLFFLLILWLSATSWIPDHGLWYGFSSSAIAAITIAGLLIVTRCVPMAQARAALDLQVLITIAAALGLGTALTKSQAAEAIALGLVSSVERMVASDWLPFVLLAVLYILTVIFTELITNVAVAAMLVPVAVEVAWTAQLNPRPFVMAIALGASLSFITPIGYQTNLMVMGPGGYHPRDFLRVGTPLALLLLVTALIFIPLAWPFAL